MGGGVAGRRTGPYIHINLFRFRELTSRVTSDSFRVRPGWWAPQYQDRKGCSRSHQGEIDLESATGKQFDQHIDCVARHTNILLKLLNRPFHMPILPKELHSPKMKEANGLVPGSQARQTLVAPDSTDLVPWTIEMCVIFPLHSKVSWQR